MGNVEDLTESDKGYIDGVLHCFNEEYINNKEAMSLLLGMTIDFETIKRFIIETFDESVLLELEKIDLDQVG